MSNKLMVARRYLFWHRRLALPASRAGACRQLFIRAAAMALGLLVAAPALAERMPDRPRIADAWFAHNAVLLMLGAADQVVVTVVRPTAQPWMYQVAPVLNHAESIDGASLNAEELLRLKTRLVFVTQADPTAPALQRAGLEVVRVGFDSFKSMLDCIDLTARTLNTPLAYQRSRDYQAYLRQALAALGQSVESLSTAGQTNAGKAVEAHPRVLHIVSVNPLKVDGAKTIIDQWIRAAGGRNAAAGISGNQQPVSIEQVLAWNPDIVILGANAGRFEGTPQFALWQQLEAVRQHRVYRNPAGVFPWDRYGPELALQLRWAAQIIGQGKVDEARMVALIRDFYRRFYAYDLAVADARRILAGLPPGH